MQNYRIKVVSALILLELYSIGTLLALIITFPGNQTIDPENHTAIPLSLLGHEFFLYCPYLGIDMYTINPYVLL